MVLSLKGTLGLVGSFFWGVRGGGVRVCLGAGEVRVQDFSQAHGIGSSVPSAKLGFMVKGSGFPVQDFEIMRT